MKVEFDPARDVMYVWLATPGTKAARTEVVSPGVHADFDRQGRLIGIEVLDASEVLQHKVQFEVSLAPSPA
jgi:uncharacterized protein YuzE